MISREAFTGPWAGLPVPWTEQDTFDEQRYRADVVRCCKAGIPGVYTGGTTGEFYAMEFDEFQAVTRSTLDECRRLNTPAMIGCTSTYTLGSIRRAVYAAEQGADAIQIALPYWMEVTSSDAIHYFKQVSDSVPGVAVSIYETTRAKKTLTLQEHMDILDAVPAYRMVKANAGTLGATADGCRQLSRRVNVFVGETSWPTLGPCGATGSCSSLVYTNPTLILHLWDLLRNQDWRGLKTHTHPLIEWDTWLADRFGSEGYTDTAYDHLQGMLCGFLNCGLHSRGPYKAATQSDLEEAKTWAERHTPSLLASEIPTVPAHREVRR